ncbi:MAG: eukaryotic-like serine/threonine-protein kinase [Blastocatellia bacterium]|jgi:hypothetical protein|nr:eukaryotic-like serine/threonine-protein kinase [Blastocatellia bacterium]
MIDRFNRFVTYLRGRLGPHPIEEPLPMVAELARYFLSDAIDDRAKVLAVEGSGEEFKPDISQQYAERLEQNLRLELKRLLQKYPRLEHLDRLDQQLKDTTLPTKLSDELFSDRYGFSSVVRGRGWVIARRLRPWEVRTIASVLLRGVQQTALDIVRTYPGQAPQIPKTTEKAIDKILSRIDEVSHSELPNPALKTLLEARTELSVLVARSRGGAHLPLRSIPTAPLSDENLENHYVGRPDAEALRLARQIRHADGTILVTGYRGSGKSSFVNRVIFHALAAQKDGPHDGWLVVPVRVNLAKASGVQHILRLTLRAVRDALLEPESLEPCHYPRPSNPNSNKSERLPLDFDREIVRLHNAYTRATWKVTFNRSLDDETSREMGIDAGQIVPSIAGVTLAKFFSAAINKKRVAKVSRGLSMLDYDENAAEDDLGRLIASLATPRPMADRQRTPVRIKLVFVFDELDKMDEKGLDKMIEGLKNLFLQQHSVFMLVTSKSFYYKLIKQRAIEDAMLGSYFSAVVHVPLLTFSQCLLMVADWIDRTGTELLTTPTADENRLVEQLTRALVYHSFGNPRDIIRELRQMQEWADTDNRPCLTDRAARGPSLKIFAAIQECIEKVVVPRSITTGPEADGSVVLASERLVGDEARLEQLRRGLYILVEALIDQQVLALEPMALEELKRTNFSLISVNEVRDMAKRLGFFLGKLHEGLPEDVFQGLDSPGRRPLFIDPQSEDVLRVTKDFYRLTGRQIVTLAEEQPESKPESRTDDQLRRDAETFAAQPGWAERLSAIRDIKRLGPAKLSPPLKEFLLDVVQNDKDSNHRLAAVEQLTHDVLLEDSQLDLLQLISNEKDDRVFSTYLSRLGAATNVNARKRATDTLVGLLKGDENSSGERRVTGQKAVVVLDALKSVADRDVTTEILDWLVFFNDTEFVLKNGLSTLTFVAEKHKVDLADKIISSPLLLTVFTHIKDEHDSLERINYLRELLRVRPLDYAMKLTLVDATEADDITRLLAHAFDLAFEVRDERLAEQIFRNLVAKVTKEEQKPSLAVVTQRESRILSALRKTTDFQNRLLPYLKTQLDILLEKQTFNAAKAERLRNYLRQVEGPPPPTTTKLEDLVANLGSLRPGFTGIGSVPEKLFERTPFGAEFAVTFTLGVIAFIPGVIFYRRDLPAPPTLIDTISSRVLLLAADWSLLFSFLQPLFKMQDKFRRDPLKADSSYAGPYSMPGTTAIQRESPLDKFQYVSIFLGATLFYLHNRNVAPLSYLNQVFQFLINLPAAILLFFAVRRVWKD